MSETRDGEMEVNEISKPPVQIAKTDSQSQVSRLRGLLNRIKTRRVENSVVDELGAVSNSEDDRQETKVDEANGELDQKPMVETLQDEQKKTELGDNNPISEKTLDRIGTVLSRVPRLNPDDEFKIPYRRVKAIKTDGVLDEETGLFVEAYYRTDEAHYGRLISPGINIILSTRLKDSNGMANMGNALIKLYGDSENVRDKIAAYKAHMDDGSYDKFQFQLYYLKNSQEVMSGFSPVSGSDELRLDRFNSEKTPVLESGGKFLEAILDRVANKQLEDYELNQAQVAEVIKRALPEAEKNDPERVYEYAYHGTQRSNIVQISAEGLQPSGGDSKEPGTIWFTDWDTVGTVDIPDGRGVVYRFKISEMPDIAKYWNGTSLEGPGSTVATDKAIPPEKLDFSIDGGKTWLPNVPKQMSEAA